MTQTTIHEVREELAGLKAALVAPGMSEVAQHIYSVEKAAGQMLDLQAPHDETERAAMRAELELLRNELRRLDDVSREGLAYCHDWSRTLGADGGYTPGGTLVEIEAMGSVVVRG